MKYYIIAKDLVSQII